MFDLTSAIQNSLNETQEKVEETSSLTEETQEQTTEQTEETKVEETQEKETTEPVAESTETPESNQPNLDEQRAELEQQIRESLTQEYEEKIRQLESQNPFANEAIKKLNELAQAGVDVNSSEFWKWQAIELDKFDTSQRGDALELRRLELEVDNPTLNAKQIDRLLKRSYPALFSDEYTAEDTEYQEALEDLSIDATRSVTKLVKHKESVQLPKVDLQQKEVDTQAQQKAREEFLRDVKTNVSNYKGFPIKLTDDLEINYQVSSDAKKYVESSIVNNQSWFIDNYVKDGKVDYPRLSRDLTRIADFDNIAKTILEQGISIGKEQVADVLENADESIQQQKAERAMSIEDQLHGAWAQTQKRR